MKEIISKIVNHIFCSHSWKAIDKTTVYSDINDNYVILVLVCEKCGKIKKIRIK